MKGYAAYRKIKNDHLSVPVVDSRTGAHLGLLKKVRLTVKLTKSKNFSEIIMSEQTTSRSGEVTSSKGDTSSQK